MVNPFAFFSLSPNLAIANIFHQEAVSRGFSFDGEIFDIHHLAYLAQFIGLDAAVVHGPVTVSSIQCGMQEGKNHHPLDDWMPYDDRAYAHDFSHG